MANIENESVDTWSRDKVKLAVLTWITFLSAAAFSVVFFAFIDPLTIVDSINVSYIESPNAGYAIGFLFLWALAWLSGWLVLRLVRRKRTAPRAIRP